VKSLRPLNESDYKPDGGTALLDAVGHTIGDVGNRLATMAESDRPSKVIFFIQTDGEENQSREFDIEKLKSMVDVQKNTFGWEFIFAGANIDAFAAGNSYSFSAASTGNYVANAAGTNNLYRSMGVYTKNLMANTSEELAADGMTLSAVMNQVENDIKKS
jgi:hypothetical protein